MGLSNPHTPVAVLLAVISRYEAALEWTVERAVEYWGPVATTQPDVRLSGNRLLRSDDGGRARQDIPFLRAVGRSRRTGGLEAHYERLGIRICGAGPTPRAAPLESRPWLHHRGQASAGIHEGPCPPHLSRPADVCRGDVVLQTGWLAAPRLDVSRLSARRIISSFFWRFARICGSEPPNLDCHNRRFDGKSSRLVKDCSKRDPSRTERGKQTHGV